MPEQKTSSGGQTTRQRGKTAGQWPRVCFVVIVTLLIVAISLAYLAAAFSAFTSFKFTLTDYGRYVNAIWNCAHGDPFRLLTQYSYLRSHLSFTLALLAPVFLIWNHPFALWIVQWLLALTGLFIMWRAMLRHRIPVEITAAFLFFAIANPYTQSVLLSEFHGVSLYLLLLPWLYYCLAFQRRMTWLPLLLIWGVREEAAFLVLPMLLYFSIKERWRTGYLWAAGSGLYGLLACTLFFEWINGFSITSQRPDLQRAGTFRMLGKNLPDRLLPLVRLAAPTLPILSRGWVPVLTFPIVALVVAMFSPYPAQYGLKFHYPAALQTCLVLGMLHGLSLFWQRQPVPSERTGWLQALFLVVITVFLYSCHGFLPFARYNTKEYRHPAVEGLSTLCAVAHIPPQGLLLCDRRSGGMCANRRDMIIWEQYNTGNWHPDIIFTRLKDVGRKHSETLQPLLANGTFGVSFFDGNHLILVRGLTPAKNKSVLQELQDAPETIRFAYTRKKGGKEVVLPDCRIVRYWNGAEKKTKTLVAYGRTVTLAAGDYLALFRFKMQPFGQPKKDHNGILRINERTTQAVLAQAEIRPAAGKEGFFEQALPFHLAEQTRVEPQVLGDRSRLWLDRVVLKPIQPRHAP